jgi:MoxR-like ATPase
MTNTQPVDWKIFLGNDSQHDGLLTLPAPPPWRFPGRPQVLAIVPKLDIQREASRAGPFKPSPEMILAVNAALYLRRPLLITGKPGTGKSTLIAKVAHELKLGPVLRWSISSRSTVRGGEYEYDAVGRLQAGRPGAEPPVEQYLTLGPLGTALRAETWPRPLLIDEIDKSDLDFANDLLNVIEEGEFEIPELRRLGKARSPVTVSDFLGEPVQIYDGRVQCGQFPFVVMTSNAEREFPAPFLRRCVRLNIDPPKAKDLPDLVRRHLSRYSITEADVQTLINEFDKRRSENQDVATDQLLNAVFLTVAMRETEARTFSDQEFEALKNSLFRQLSGPLS